MDSLTILRKRDKTHKKLQNPIFACICSLVFSLILIVADGLYYSGCDKPTADWDISNANT